MVKESKYLKNTSLKTDSGIPLYYQIKEIIIQQITNGNYKPGDLLPSEEVSAKEYKVSQGTIRRAMSDLVNAGILYRRSGFGTIVRAPKLEYSLGKLHGFSEILSEKGLVPSSKVLKFEVVSAKDASVLNSLKLPGESDVFRISRVKFVNDEPLYLEHFYLPFDKFSDISKEELNTLSLYDLLKKKYGIVIKKAEEFLEPVVVDEYESKILGIKKGAPAMRIEGILYSDEKNPIMFIKDIIRGDRCRYYFELHV